MGQLDAVVFDFDGVVIDSEPIHLKGFQLTLAEIGLDISVDDYYQKYLGFDDHDCFAAVLADNGKARDEKLIAELTANKTLLVLREITESIKSKTFPGAIALIRACKDARIPLCICSGALRAEITLAAKTIGIISCFVDIISAEDVKRGKPDPEGYNLAIKTLSKSADAKISSANCVAIEDSPAGIASAKAAGMNVLAVTTSYAREKLTAADKIVTSLEDVSVETLASLVN